MMRTRILVGTLAMLLSAGVFADGRDGDGDESGPPVFFAAGALVSVEQSLYSGGENGVDFLPLLLAQLGPVYVRGTRFGVYLYGRDDLTVSAGIALDLRDTDWGDSPQLADMDELDNVVLGELRVSREAEWGNLDLSFAADVSGRHDGYLAGLFFGQPFEVGRLEVEPRVGIKWQSAKVIRYYYGVGAADVQSDRPLYQPDGGVSFEFGVAATYPFAERHALRFEVRAESVSSEVSESPIVDRGSFVNIRAGYFFRF